MNDSTSGQRNPHISSYIFQTALITIEVHARDVIEKLMRVSCTSANDFEWASQLRFYWEKNDCVIKQVDTFIQKSFNLVEIKMVV